MFAWMGQEEFESRMSAGEDPVALVAESHARDTSRLGYVVVEYNQASGLPSVPLHDIMERDEAHEFARGCRAAIARTSRGERYAVAAIRLVEKPS